MEVTCTLLLNIALQLEICLKVITNILERMELAHSNHQRLNIHPKELNKLMQIKIVFIHLFQNNQLQLESKLTKWCSKCTLEEFLIALIVEQELITELPLLDGDQKVELITGL